MQVHKPFAYRVADDERGFPLEFQRLPLLTIETIHSRADRAAVRVKGVACELRTLGAIRRGELCESDGEI